MIQEGVLHVLQAPKWVIDTAAKVFRDQLTMVNKVNREYTDAYGVDGAKVSISVRR